MPAVKDLGIVLRRLDYSETSQVLVVFCRASGQQRLIAKGIKRPTKARASTGIDLLELGDVVFSRRPGSRAELGTLTEWRQRPDFVTARRALATWYAVQYAADRTAQTTQENDPHPGLFEALRELLARCSPAQPLRELVSYLMVLLQEIGLMPQWQRCAGCGTAVAARGSPGEPPIRPPAAYFSARQGGPLCRDCEPAYVEKRRVTPATLVLLAAGADQAALGSAAPADLLAAFDLLDYYLTETLGKPSRLAGLLREAVARGA